MTTVAPAEPNSPPVTTYFRTTFTVADAAACYLFFLEVLRADGRHPPVIVPLDVGVAHLVRLLTTVCLCSVLLLPSQASSRT